MGKKRINRKQPQNTMDVDQPAAQPDSGEWETLPPTTDGAAPAEDGFLAMDTGDFAKDKKKKKKQGIQLGLHKVSMKHQKRGNRTKAQKKRKADKLSKALSVSSRREERLSKAGSKNAFKVSSKKLWGAEES